MIHLLFTVYDSKAEVYLPPFFVPTVGIATRAFKDCINSEEHQFGKHPHDYTLFSLGKWLDTDATMESNTPKSLGNGLEYIDPDNVNAFEDFKNDSPNTPIQPDKNSGNTA